MLTLAQRNEEQYGRKIKALWIKYEEIIAYLIVGGLTTVVSWAAKFLANFLLFDNTMYPTPFQNVVLSVINWTAGVIFAYFTNRKFVFKSNAPMLSEAPKFVLSRVSTLILDMVVMQVLTAIGVNLLVATLISAVLVIIGNYVFSKLFVFNKKKTAEQKRQNKYINLQEYYKSSPELAEDRKSAGLRTAFYVQFIFGVMPDKPSTIPALRQLHPCGNARSRGKRRHLGR